MREKTEGRRLHVGVAEHVKAQALLYRTVLFAGITLVTIIFYYMPLKTLFSMSLQNELYSHLPIIPFISGYLIYKRRKTILSDANYSFAAGCMFMLTGVLLQFAGRNLQGVLPETDYFSIIVTSAIVFWTGGFVLSFGVSVVKKMIFPILFLLFMVPMPTPVLSLIIPFLQWSSSEVANGLFTLTGVPFLREGYTYHLTTLSVEVAKQCSGIRSSIALFIISVLAGHMFLRTGWKKIVLSLSVLPVAVFKNGIRIVTLSLLGAYVDERILSSALHRRGGIPFFVVALIIWTTILWILKKSEKDRTY